MPSVLDSPIVKDNNDTDKTITVDFDLCKDFSDDYIKKRFSHISFDDNATEFDIENLDKDWGNMQIQEKGDVISKWVSFISEKIELNNAPDVAIYHGENKSHYGGYDVNSNTILLNDSRLDTPQQTVKTIAHELWHAHQYECAAEPKSFRHLLYRDNFSNYIEPHYNYDLYRSQLVEVEARAFSAKIIESVKNVVERR